MRVDVFDRLRSRWKRQAIDGLGELVVYAGYGFFE